MGSASSIAFDQLEQAVQRWVWQQGWLKLRDIQEEAIPPILAGRDVLISSATASGKTEAAFLPICTAIAADPPESLGVLYVSPLKALINDQIRRLESLFECIDAPITPWHGDVPSSLKRRLVDYPRGALLITPESLEALFVTRGTSVSRMFVGLRYVVVDELHAFIGKERGQQLQSLLHRVDLAADRSIPRVALSATLGDLAMASEFLRPLGGENVHRITSTVFRQDIKMQVRGYRLTGSPLSGEQSAQLEQFAAGDDIEISKHLYSTLRGSTNLVFTNRRIDVERYTDLLRRCCERDRMPNEFWPHHGSLSREIREEAEDALHSGRPATIVATSTLELGIDIGALDSIAQIDAPGSVASLRQRLGRSGRSQAQPAVIRIYVQESEITDATAPQDQLRATIVQTVAMIRLLLKRWVEPPPPNALHLSTLVQQVLSLIAQHGGFKAAEAYRKLCASGPFRTVAQATFARLLRDLAEHELITQTHEGTIVLDLAGERIVNHYDFYAAFVTPDEWRLLVDGRSIGTLPITFPLAPGLFLIFAGRRWRIANVDEGRHEIILTPAPGGIPPKFGGSAAMIHDQVREEMLRVYLDHDVPAFLDATGRVLLSEGRDAFRRLGLGNASLLVWGRDTLLFPWVGDRSMHTLTLQLRVRGLAVAHEGTALLVQEINPAELRTHLQALIDSDIPVPTVLAAVVSNKQVEKYHAFLGENLLAMDYASSQLDAKGARRTCLRLVGTESSPGRSGGEVS